MHHRFSCTRWGLNVLWRQWQWWLWCYNAVAQSMYPIDECVANVVSRLWRISRSATFRWTSSLPSSWAYMSAWLSSLMEVIIIIIINSMARSRHHHHHYWKWRNGQILSPWCVSDITTLPPQRQRTIQISLLFNQDSASVCNILHICKYAFMKMTSDLPGASAMLSLFCSHMMAAWWCISALGVKYCHALCSIYDVYAYNHDSS